MREATLTRWYRRVGDQVHVGEPLADLVTDKVEVTLEVPESGTVRAILVEEGATVPVGTLLAVIE